MSATRGCFGKIKAGANFIAQLRSWSVEESAAEIDVSVMGDCTKAYDVGAVETSFTASGFWDTSDTGQTALVVGSTVAVELYPGGDASGKAYYTGDVIVQSVNKSADIDGVVEFSVSGKINGGLTQAAVA